jgi:TonB family protein
LREKIPKKHRRSFLLSTAVAMGVAGCFVWVFFFTGAFRPLLDRGWRTLTQGSKRILGWETNGPPPEENRIREEVILKKMEEASLQHDWRGLAPEYPRPAKQEALTGKERVKVLKESPEFKAIEKEMDAYLKKKEELFQPELPTPSMKEGGDLTSQKDKGVEKVMERLMNGREKSSQGTPLEENLSLGMKGPLASRKILERPSPPQARVRVEAEIELMLFVTASGTVDRVIPSVKGDAELERVAIQYLKQWRFAALPKDHPQVEEWGTIPFKFKLQ